MKTCIVTLCLSLLLSLQLWGVSAFTTKQFLSRSSAVSNTELFFFGGPKDDGSPGDYVCKVGSVFYLTMGLCVFVCVSDLIDGGAGPGGYILSMLSRCCAPRLRYEIDIRFNVSHQE